MLNDYTTLGQYGQVAPSVNNLGGLMPQYGDDAAPNYASPQIPTGSPAQASGWNLNNLLPGVLGSTDADGMKTQGWGGLALGAASGIGNLFLGMQQYGLAKDAFKEGKRQFNLNYDAQRKATNTQLEDRQRARVASNPGAYQSVGAYMDKNGV